MSTLLSSLLESYTARHELSGKNMDLVMGEQEAASGMHHGGAAPLMLPRLHAKPRQGTVEHVVYLEARKLFLDRKHAELIDPSLFSPIAKVLMTHANLSLLSTLEAELSASASASGSASVSVSVSSSNSGLKRTRSAMLQEWKRKVSTYINYEQYSYAASQLVDDGILSPAQASEYLSPAAFLMHTPDAQGRVSVALVLAHITKKTAAMQTRIALSVHDVDGDGFLTEQDLDAFVYEAIPAIPHIAAIPESFYPFYTCAAARKFLFFLDPMRRGMVDILDLLQSDVLAEFVAVTTWNNSLFGALGNVLADLDSLVFADTQLMNPLGGSTGSSAPSGLSSLPPIGGTNKQPMGLLHGAGSMGITGNAAHMGTSNATVMTLVGVPSTSRVIPRKNWFGRDFSLAVYSTFLDLDLDANGMLAPDELEHWNSGMLTETFVSRVFAVSHTYDGQMDYKAYLDFVLAQTYKTDPVSLAYHFRVLDVSQSGKITVFTINYFFRDLSVRVSMAGADPAAVEDVKDEIFDMVKPKDPFGITLDDLVKCKVGDTVVSILSDVVGFIAYENRENQSSAGQDDDGDSADD
eukprot:ANDGO_06696.mRNA.1 putative serine/threonine-protein phosphatase 2A regulatory subunit B'' subunit TON2